MGDPVEEQQPVVVGEWCHILSPRGVRKTVEVAEKIAQKVWSARSTYTRKKLRSSFGPTVRELFEAGLSHAEAEGWISFHVEDGQGADKKIIRPGDTRPDFVRREAA